MMFILIRVKLIKESYAHPENIHRDISRLVNRFSAAESSPYRE